MKKKAGNYKLCWDYLKEGKIYFWVIIGIFLFSAVIGFLFPIFFTETIAEFIAELEEKTAGMNFFSLLVFILKNNTTSAFLGMILGLILGIFPVIMDFMNGYVLGFVSNKAVGEEGFSVLLRLLPHGIFEIPALFLSLGLGLRLGISLFMWDAKKKLVYNLKNSLRVFIYIILPLLIIAAIIEAGLMVLLS